MSTINEILDTLEQEVNDGIKVTKRLQQKTFGLFKNPTFLLTFFTIIFFVIGYKIYHHYKREDDTRCSVYNDPEKCPKYCVWDTEELSCSPKLKVGNVCPDYWTTTLQGDGTIKCTDDKNVCIKNSGKINTSCYTDSKNSLNIKEGKIQGANTYKDHCTWIKNCGTWEGQSIGKFGCGSGGQLNPKAADWSV